MLRARPRACASSGRLGAVSDAMDVDAVAHGTGDAVAIPPPHQRRALALLGDRAALTARARVGGQHELEPRREDGRLGGPRHHDVTALERLAQRVEDVGGELGRLVEEQHAAVRQRQRAGPDAAAAAAHDGHRARRVVRVDERRTTDQRRVGRQRAGQRVHRTDLERVAVREIGKQAGQPMGQHRLADAGRTDHEQVVPAGRGDDQRGARLLLAGDVGDVERPEPLGAAPGEPADVVERRHRRVVGLLVADEHRDRLPQRPHARPRRRRAPAAPRARSTPAPRRGRSPPRPPPSWPAGRRGPPAAGRRGPARRGRPCRPAARPGSAAWPRRPPARSRGRSASRSWAASTAPG